MYLFITSFIMRIDMCLCQICCCCLSHTEEGEYNTEQ